MAWSLGQNYWFAPRAFGEVELTKPVWDMERVLSFQPGVLLLDISLRFFLFGQRVKARVLSLLPGRTLKGRLILRPSGSGAVSIRRASLPFGRKVEVPLEARDLPDGPFLVEFDTAEFVKTSKGVCAKGLWLKACALKARARTEIERLLSAAVMEALKQGRADEALRALERLSALLEAP